MQEMDRKINQNLVHMEESDRSVKEVNKLKEEFEEYKKGEYEKIQDLNLKALQKMDEVTFLSKELDLKKKDFEL